MHCWHTCTDAAATNVAHALCCSEGVSGNLWLVFCPCDLHYSAPCTWCTCLTDTVSGLLVTLQRVLQNKRIDAFAAHPGTAKTAIWDKMDKNKVEGVAFDLTAKVSDTLAWEVS